MPYGVFVHMHRFLLPMVFLSAATGCHTFQPASVGDLTAGQSVRVRVTGAFSDSMGSVLQTEDPRRFEAVVASREGSSFFLDVPVEQSLRGMRFETLNQRVEVPTSAFVELETKQLHQGRTIAAAGIAAAIIGTVVVYQLSQDSGAGTIGGGGGPVESVVSLQIFGLSMGGAGRPLGR